MTKTRRIFALVMVLVMLFSFNSFALSSELEAGDGLEISLDEVQTEQEELPGETPVDDPADEPVDDPADEPADDPADESADDLADEPADEPAEGEEPVEGEEFIEAPQFMMEAAAEYPVNLYFYSNEWETNGWWGGQIVETPLSYRDFIIHDPNSDVEDNVVISGRTDGNGKASVNLPSGTYTVEISFTTRDNQYGTRVYSYSGEIEVKDAALDMKIEVEGMFTEQSAEQVYNSTRTFNHVDVRVHGKFSDGTRTYDVRIGDVKIEQIDRNGTRTLGTFNYKTSYEWQVLNLSVPKDATIRVTYKVYLKDKLVVNTDSTDGSFTQEFSGKATFVEAIQRCDIKQGLDFAISAEQIVEQIQKFLKNVTYSWSVENDDRALAGQLETELNKIADPPAGEKNIEFEEGSAGSHTVDTSWPEGTHLIVQLGDKYYRLHFQGWSTWTNETNTTPQELNGSTLAITSNTDIHGVWIVEELPVVVGYGTLTKVIEGISENELGSLKGRYIHIINPEKHVIDVEFSQMEKSVADGTITLTYSYPITVEGEFTFTEAGVDVTGYTRETTSSVSGGYADAEGDELLGGYTKAETVGGDTVVIDVKLPSATTYAVASSTPNMGNVQFTNKYTKAWSENVKFVYPKLTLFKIDGDNDIALQGAEFKLTPSTEGATPTQSGITDQSGYIFFDELKPGDYELVETAAPEGYVKGYAVYKVVVTEPDTTNPNTPYTEVMVDGVWYKQYECLLEVGYNIGNGWYPSTNLVKREGDYRLRAYNEKLMGELTVTKKFAGDLTAEDFGGSIRVTVSGPNNYSNTVELNAENDWTMVLTGLESGDYTVTEDVGNAAKTGYELNAPEATTVSITIDDLPAGYDRNAPVAVESVELVNTYKRQFTEIHNLPDLQINKYVTGTTNLLDGAVFTLTSAEGEARTATTVNGSAVFEKLAAGIYSLQETTAPDGYVSDGTVYTVTVAQNGEPVVEEALTDGKFTKTYNYTIDVSGNNFEDGILSVYNEKDYNEDIVVLPDLHIKKVNAADTDEMLGGAEFTLTDEFDKVRTETTVDGVASFADIPEGDYVLVETESPEGFAYDGTIYNVNVALAEGYPTEKLVDGKFQMTYVYELSVDGIKLDGNTLTVENTRDEGSITITKKFGKDNDYTPDSVELSVAGPDNYEESVILKREDGFVATITGLPLGTYTITEDEEKAQAVGYVLEITGNGAQVTIDSVNHTGSATITNTYVLETVTFSAVKEWEDNDNQDGIRPEEVIVYVKNGETTVDTLVLKAENGWKATSKELPKFDNGVEINYTVTEAEIKGYTPAINVAELSENNDYSVSITNTHIPETIAVEGGKTWNDNGDQDGKRPDSITIILLANGKEEKKATVTAEDGWKWSFTDLPKYEKGEEIVYTITEETVEYYSTKVEGYNVINSYTPETVNVEGSKTWIDGDDQDGLRPDSITIILLANGKEEKRATVTAKDDWKWSFTDLPVYKNGEKIKYAIDEIKIEGYETIIDGFNVTNKHTPATVSFGGEKFWYDENDQDGIRPDSVTIRVMNGSTEVATSVASAATDWKWSVSDLPMYDKGVEIKYTITEDGVAGYETTYRDWDVINSYTPETIDIHGVKTWNMGAYPNAKKPEGVIINLYADGELVDYTVASAKGGWEWSFTDMPKNSAGEPIEYTVAEEPILDFASTVTGSVEEGFTVTNTYAPRTGSLYIYKEEVFWLNGRQVSESPDGRGGEWYDISVTIDGWTEQVRIQGGGEPVVYHNLPYGTTYSVEEIIPEGALFSSDIYDRGYGYIDARSTGVDVVNTYHYDVENAAFTAVKVDSETLQPVAGAGFTLYADAACTSVLANTVSDAQGNIVLPISGAGTYYLVETTTPAGYYANETVYTIVAESSFVVAEGNVITRKLTVTAEGLTSENGAYVIKNTAIKPADVSVQKVWNDNGYTIDRPESIDVTLLRDGAPYETVKLNSANGWFYSWDGLTDEYTWTVDEVNVPADYAKTVANNGDMWTITNTRETVTVSGVKTWDLAGYENVVIPESVTIRLLANGIEIASTTANAEGNWAWSFGVLPATVNGAKIVYTVSEDAVEDFISAVTGDAATGYVVTNTYSPKLGGLTISKQVKGSGADKDEAFTFTLTLTGMTGEVAYTGAANGTFNAAEALTFTLAHGQSITVTGILAGTQYTVVETAHEDYSSEAINAAGTVAEGEAAKVDFVNTYIAEDEDEVIVDIPKTGDDSNRMALPVLIALAIMWLGVGYYVIKRKLFA